jgi:hypothetical protein
MPGTGKKSPIRRGLGSLKALDASSAGRPERFGKPNRTLISDLNWERWSSTDKALWAPDTFTVKQAITQMAEWEKEAAARRQPELYPAYVAATRQLVAATLSDNECLLSDEVLQNAYCGAITRAVVELTERGKASGTTYRQRAVSMQLPTEIVEARNLAAHGRAPPLASLRWAVLVTLRHLKADYWDEQRKHIDAVIAAQAEARAQSKAVEHESVLASVDSAAAKVIAQTSLSLAELREKLGRIKSATTVAVPTQPRITTWT